MKPILKFASMTGILLLLAGCVSQPATSIPSPSVSSVPHPGPTIVTLTFDEGFADNYPVKDLLASHNMHATFYVVSGHVGTEGYMTWEQLQEFYADGNEIAGHTVSHPDLPKLNEDEMRHEICDDRAALMQKGFNPVSFAYPSGHWNETVKKVVAECGYNSARLVVDGPDTIPPGDPFALKTLPYIFSDTPLSKIKRYVTGIQNNGGGWIIFVFHYVCDDCHQYSITLDNLTALIDWLQSKSDDMITVKSIAEVVGGEVKPVP